MRFIFMSDMHGTSKPPRSRLGDIAKDFSDKLEAIFKLSYKHNYAPIISSGDCFNSPRDINAFFTFLQIRKKYKRTKFFTVIGQHDMYFRSVNSITNLSILQHAEAITLLGSEPFSYDGHAIYGRNWFDKSTPSPDPNNRVNILAVHAPISNQPINSHVNSTLPAVWTRKNKGYDYICCGDIHKAFICDTPNGLVVNSGPIMRLTTDKHIIRHRPHVVLIDTERKSAKKIFLPYKPYDEVLNLNYKHNETDDLGVSGLALNTEALMQVDLIEIINQLIEQSKNPKGIRAAIEHVANKSLKEWR